MTRVIILDRDGVLNKMVIDPEHGTIDSPLHPSQVTIFPWVSESLYKIKELGYKIFIATNQPAAAKNKTSKQNLIDVHKTIMDQVQKRGVVIDDYFICWAKQEDNHAWRKPKPGMLLEALNRVKKPDIKQSWMVGDGVTDVQAGLAAGLQTAFLGPEKCDICSIFDKLEIKPSYRGKNLLEFVQYLTFEKKNSH